MIIFLVIGNNGLTYEYREWNVKAFHNRLDAENFCYKLDNHFEIVYKKYQEWLLFNRDDTTSYPKELAYPVNELDKNASVSSPTQYEIREIEIE